jgi:hypothetical protein
MQVACVVYVLWEAGNVWLATTQINAVAAAAATAGVDSPELGTLLQRLQSSQSPHITGSGRRRSKDAARRSLTVGRCVERIYHHQQQQQQQQQQLYTRTA